MRSRWRRSIGTLLFVIATSAPASAAPEAAVRVRVLPEGLRVDPARGVVIDGDEATLGRSVDEVPALSASPLRLRAARDETIALQVALSAPSMPGARSSTAATAKIKLTPFLYDGGAVAPIRGRIAYERAISIREPSRSPQIHALGAADYPDILVPTTTVAIPRAPSVAMLWVELFVPAATPPGVVRAKLAVEGAAPIDVEVEVIDLLLPALDVAKLGAVNFGSLLELEKKDPKRFRAWMQLAHAHHLTIELMRPTPKIADDGTIDWEGWAARVGPFVDGSAFSAAAGYEGPREGQPITRFIAPLSERWPVKADADGFLPSDPAAWSRALGTWAAFVRAKGWRDRPSATEWVVFINALDEPKTEAKLRALAAWDPLFAAAHLAPRDRPRFRGDGVLGARIEGWPDTRKLDELGRVVDLWNVHGATDTAPIALLREKAPRAGVMFYASSSGGEPAIPPLVVDSAIAGARAWAWLVARYELAGALNWEVDLQGGCVADPQCTKAGLNLDATLIYRGHEVGAAAFEPIPSMRLAALRRGVDDIRLLSLLRTRDPDAAEVIVHRMVPRALGDDLPRFGRGTWPRDAAAWSAVRDELLDRLSGRPPERGDSALVLRTALAIIVLLGGATIVIAIRWVLKGAPPWAR